MRARKKPARLVNVVTAVAEDRLASWRAAAEHVGMTLDEFVVAAANDRAEIELSVGRDTANVYGAGMSTNGPLAAVPARKAVAAALGRRTSMCIHRRKADEFCARCDATGPR